MGRNQQINNPISSRIYRLRFSFTDIEVYIPYLVSYNAL